MFFINVIVINKLIKKSPIPVNVQIIVLVLCLTTSVSLFHLSLGYFKLINRPNSAEKSGVKKENSNI